MKYLILFTFCFATVVNGQTPPYGVTNTNPVSQRSYSATQRRPADETVTSGSCTAGTCDLTMSAPTNFLTGDWVTIAGTSVADIAPVGVTAVSRSGSTTVTLTLAVTTPISATEKFYLEGPGCPQAAGTWTAATASGTTVTFASLETTTLNLSALTTCTLNAAVQLTKMGASALRFTKAGASGSFVVGTVASTRILPPAQGSSYTNEYGTPVKVFLNASSGHDSSPACGNGYSMRNFHSTTDAINRTDELYMVIQNTNPHCLYSMTNGSFVAQLGTGQGAASGAKWARAASEPYAVYYRSGTDLCKIPDAKNSPNSVLCGASALYRSANDGYIELGISGPNAAAEGDGVSPSGRYMALALKVSSSPESWDVGVWDLQTASMKWRYVFPLSTGNIDYTMVLDDGSSGVRWSTNGPNNVTAGRSGSTITFTAASGAFGPVTNGSRFFVEKCSDPNFNRFYTIVSNTATTLVATDAAVIGTTATNCAVATVTRGVGSISADGLTYTPIAATGAHGQFTLDAAGHPVWVAHENSSQATACPNNVGGAMRHLEESRWTLGTNYSTSMLCIWNAPYSNAGASFSARQGWVSLRIQNTNTGGPNASEPTLGPTYDSWGGFGTGEGEVILAKLVEPGVAVPFYRLARTRNIMDTAFGYVTMSADLRYISWPEYYRYSNGADADIPRETMSMIDLGNWFSGGISLSSISPNQGTQGTTIAVTLTGTNMSGASPVINISGTGVTYNTLVQVNSTTWTANFVIDPAASVGNRSVSVSTVDGTSSAINFIAVLASSGPTLTSITPTSGRQAQVVQVVLSGTGFDPSQVVNISGSGVTVQSSLVSSTAILASFIISDTANTGARNVSVTTGAGTSGSQTFTVLGKPILNSAGSFVRKP